MNICVDHNNVMYDSESDMSKAHGVSLGLYQARRNKGLSIKECLTPYKSPFSQDEGFLYKGKAYKSLRACCAELNILYHSVYQQVKRNGLSSDEAIDKIVENTEKRRNRNVA